MSSAHPHPAPSGKPHVVIIGAGFAGLNAATALKDAPVHVTVVDRRNHHLFQPLLYQVATAALSPAEIAAPIRHILRKQLNTRVLMGDVTTIDVDRKTVQLGDSELHYDYLVVAAGARHSYFGKPEWEAFAPGLKSLEEALDIRRRIFTAFEHAEATTDAAERARQMTFVIVGGGPTGVEMAGAIAEIARQTIANEFDHINPRDCTILLVEALDRILPPFPEVLAASAHKTLVGLGVTVRTKTMVTGMEDGVVFLGEEQIQAATIIWAAGVQASPLGSQLSVETDRGGRVPVQPDLSLAAHPEVFVAGDQASLSGPAGKPYPGVAPVAMQMGQLAGENIIKDVAGQARAPFAYRDRGNMAIVGRNHAVAQLGNRNMTGFIAWLAWLFVHIINLVGFRNRLVVLIHWFFSYVTAQRSARLITETVKPAPRN